MKNWRGGFSEYYFGKGKSILNNNAGNNLICQPDNVIIPSVSLYDLGSNEAAIVRVTPAPIEYFLFQNGLNPIPVAAVIIHYTTHINNII